MIDSTVSAPTISRKAAAVSRRAELVQRATPAQLAELGLAHGQRYTRPEVAALLRVGRSTIHAAIERHNNELVSHGLDPVDGTFTPGAIMALGLALTPGTGIAARFQAVLDPDNDPTELRFGAGKAHLSDMGGVIDLGTRLAGLVQAAEPGEVWAEVRALDDYTKTALIVSLLWTTSQQGGRLARLAGIDPDRRTHPMGGSPRAGLATVVPTRETAHGLTAEQASPITDAVVGL